MKKLLVGTLLWAALVAPACAAEPPKEFTLKVTQQELDYIGSLLNERPLKDAMPLFLKLQQQVVAQQQSPINSPPPENGGYTAPEKLK